VPSTPSFRLRDDGLTDEQEQTHPHRRDIADPGKINDERLSGSSQVIETGLNSLGRFAVQPSMQYNEKSRRPPERLFPFLASRSPAPFTSGRQSCAYRWPENRQSTESGVERRRRRCAMIRVEVPIQPSRRVPRCRASTKSNVSNVILNCWRLAQSDDVHRNAGAADGCRGWDGID
jgi:hypothetical protein